MKSHTENKLLIIAAWRAPENLILLLCESAGLTRRPTLKLKRKRHTPEEIIKKLREAATLLAGGQSLEDVCKKLEVSPPTYHRWKQEYGGAKVERVKRLKELEKENTRLKRLVADVSLDKAILKEIAEGKW